MHCVTGRIADVWVNSHSNAGPHQLHAGLIPLHRLQDMLRLITLCLSLWCSGHCRLESALCRSTAHTARVRHAINVLDMSIR